MIFMDDMEIASVLPSSWKDLDDKFGFECVEKFIENNYKLLRVSSTHIELNNEGHKKFSRHELSRLVLKDDEIVKPLSVQDLKDILGITIKADDTNKVITFLGMLTAYTEDSQINISFRAPSSTGKSYIPLEIASFFPKDDIQEVAYSSPTAFFHDKGEWDEERQCVRVNLERKILIFVDMPHDSLLHRLRPLLSHDRKELVFKITDKREKSGLRTKNVVLRGYPSVVFCTASLKMDEQESTRNILLSPQMNQEKLREAVLLKIKKSANAAQYRTWLQQDERREVLRRRIERIRDAHIADVIIRDTKRIEEKFLSRKLKPRDARDVGRLMSIIKSLALLNLWNREREGDSVIASDQDIEDGFAIWSEIGRAQELGLSPYLLRLFEEVIKPLANESGIKRKDVIAKHYEVYEKPLSDEALRREILPLLEAAGLVSQEPSEEDRRVMLIRVLTIPQNNRGPEGGVESEVTPPRNPLYLRERVVGFIRTFKETNGKKPTVEEVLTGSGATEEGLDALRQSGWVMEMPAGYLDAV